MGVTQLPHKPHNCEQCFMIGAGCQTKTFTNGTDAKSYTAVLYEYSLYIFESDVLNMMWKDIRITTLRLKIIRMCEELETWQTRSPKQAYIVCISSMAGKVEDKLLKSSRQTWLPWSVVLTELGGSEVDYCWGWTNTVWDCRAVLRCAMHFTLLSEWCDREWKAFLCT